MRTKRSASLVENFEVQGLGILVDCGVIPAVYEKHGNARPRCMIPDDFISNLAEGEYYVTCAGCGKKMLSITDRHVRSCGCCTSLSEYRIKFPGSAIMCSFKKSRLKKTEEQKDRQSKVLKARFLTDEGEETRIRIGEASRKTNSDPLFKKRKRETSLRVQGTSLRVQGTKESREASSKRSKRMWENPDNRAKIAEYNSRERDSVLERALNARKHHKKTSNLHLSVKALMDQLGLESFKTELPVGFYHLDEGDLGRRIAVEVDGCYWHGCMQCGYPGVPGIRALDTRKQAYLVNRGWSVLRIRECDYLKDRQLVVSQLLSIKEDT